MSNDVVVHSFVPEAINGVSEGTLKAMLKTAIKVVTQAKSLSPFRFGQLKGSIMWKSQKSSGLHTEGEQLSGGVGPLEYHVGTAVEHGVYQEFGTRKMDAQPYLRPAVDIVTNGAGFEQAVKKAMNDTVREKLLKVSAGFI